MTRRVDFSALAAEVTPGEFIEADFGDRVFKLRAMLPVECSEAWRDEHYRIALGLLVLDDGEAGVFADRMLVGHPHRAELAARVNSIYAAVDDLVGEAHASSAHSATDGAPSSSTSKPSTDSTSAG